MKKTSTSAASPENTIRPKESARTEAFSDGVFAIVITLLVLDLDVPPYADGHLPQALLKNWAAYVAFFASFVYVGVIWLNHHGLFKHIVGVNLRLNWANLGVLLGAVIIPFPTQALATAFSRGDIDDERVAVILYALAGVIMSLSWLILFYVLRSNPRLLKDGVRDNWASRQWPRPVTGIILYMLCGLAGWLISPVVGVVGIALMIIYHAATSEGVSAKYSLYHFLPEAGGRASLAGTKRR
jgi:uncharacterized membrane protein